MFFFTRRRRHTMCALVTVVQTCALPIWGSVVRDLFEIDHGGWLTDVGLLDRLVAAKLEAESLRIGAEGWQWVDAAEEDIFKAGRGLRMQNGRASWRERVGQYVVNQVVAVRLKKKNRIEEKTKNRM